MSFLLVTYSQACLHHPQEEYANENSWHHFGENWTA
jgi:hypothetical protein